MRVFISYSDNGTLSYSYMKNCWHNLPSYKNRKGNGDPLIIMLRLLFQINIIPNKIVLVGRNQPNTLIANFIKQYNIDMNSLRSNLESL